MTDDDALDSLDTLTFASEQAAAASTGEPWLMLVVDDEPDVHAVTRLTLSQSHFEGRAVRLLHAHSAAEGRALLAANPAVALILLDVVMESERAGLELVRHVREALGNREMRIVLRTGQPGVAPARSVMQDYEIDDYRSKTELTSERLHLSIATALRTFALLLGRRHRELALLQVNQELERFAYVASHDLQTPLRAIVGYTQLLQRRHAPAMDRDGQALLASVVAQGSQLSQLIRDLLEYSELSRVQRNVQPVALAALVERVRARLAGLIDERGALLQIGSLAMVEGDPMMLEQALVNLVDNAIRFQPGDAPKVRIAAVESEEHIDLQVSDEGMGLAAVDLARVLEGFHRVQPAEGESGTGLGLAICSKVARLHGGLLLAQSAPGKGSTFTLRLPRVPV